MSYKEECDTCMHWNSGEGLVDGSDWVKGGDWGQCSQIGDETRYDQYCAAFKLDPSVALRNGWEE